MSLLTIAVELQLLVILQSVLLGAGMGILYDLLRALRRHFCFGKAGTAVCDLIFWIISLSAFFRFSVASAVGQSRYYVIAGLLIGAGIYIMLVSESVLELLEYILSFFGFIYSKALQFGNYLKKRVSDFGILDKIRVFGKKVCSNPFHFGLKRYKIRKTSVSLRWRQRGWRK